MKSKMTGQERVELKEFAERIKDELKGRVELIKLFGSASRGELDEDSDLDVLIVTKDEPFKIRKKVTRIATDMLLKYGRYISLKIYSQKEYEYLNKLETPFMINIKKEGKILWKTNYRGLLAEPCPLSVSVGKRVASAKPTDTDNGHG